MCLLTSSIARKMSACSEEAALCHAAVCVTIDGTEATVIRVEILEGCIHRAAAFDASMLPSEHAPVSEAYGIRVKFMLEKEVQRNHCAFWRMAENSPYTPPTFTRNTIWDRPIGA